MAAQPRADDDAERALRAEEHLREVGADRGARRAAGRDERAVGEHDVEALDDVLDLPVARRQLARATARDPTADGRQRHRLRPVPARDAVLARAARPRTRRRTFPRARRRAARCRSTATMPVSAGEVEQDAAEHGHARAAHAAAARGRGDRDPGSLQRRSTACTCATSCGLTTTDARAATCASSAQIIASGHQSRLASATVARRVDHLGAGRAQALAGGVVDLDPPGPEVIADVAGAERDGRSRCSPVGLHAGRLRNQAGGCDSASSAVSGRPPASRSSVTSAR